VTYTRPISASLLTSGLAGTLGYTVRDVVGSILVARTTSGVTEDGSSAIYSASVANWDSSWAGFVIWDAGAGTLAREDFLAYTPGGGGSVTVAGYAAGQDPASLTWAASTRSLTDKAGFSLSSVGLNAIAGFKGWNFPQSVRALIAFVIGKRTGVPISGTTGTVTYGDVVPGDYGTVTVDTGGNITANNMTPPT
jgi:hypothetical protein